MSTQSPKAHACATNRPERSRWRRASGAAASTILALATQAARADSIDFEVIAGGLDRITTITSTVQLPDTAFIVEQVGRVQLLESGAIRPLAFLDITDRVRSSGFEQGLTGFALAPAFPANPHVYVHYIRADNASVISRFRLLPGPLLAADPATESVLLSLAQPHPTHNCNEVRFGPDSYLYIGCGDGGPPFTPVHDPQSLAELYGKILRIDVNNIPIGQNYGIPADNPFVGTPGAAPEVWALGLRNPYRFSFDPINGDLWLGDVGQSTWEEVNRVVAGSPFGVNFGWNRMEAAHCYPPGSPCDTTGLHLPVLEYDHAEGCAVIGGMRLRGNALPLLQDAYVYADFCSGVVYAARTGDGSAWQAAPLGTAPRAPTAFGLTPSGELLLGSYGIGDAVLYRIVIVDAIFADPFETP